MSNRFIPSTILTLCLGIATSTVQGGRIDEGTIEAGTAITLDFEGPNGTTFEGDLLGGYFLQYGLLVGGRIGFHIDDDITRWSFLPFVEQHFETDTALIPYVGASVGLIHYSSDIGEKQSDTAFLVGLTGGIKFFITEQAALDLNLNLAMASEDVYIADGKPDNVDITLKFGLRYLLDIP